MNDMQKEWKTYTKRVVLKRLYNENRDQRVTDFLENYDLIKVNVLNDIMDEFEMEILFSKENEILRITAKFKTWGQLFSWTMPDEFNIIEIDRILNDFNFVSWAKK
jgi:hypothetical protein